MGDQFVSCAIREIVVGKPLPVPLYVYIDFRFITFRAAGDIIDRQAYERFEQKKVKNLFVMDKDHPVFMEWSKKG